MITAEKDIMKLTKIHEKQGNGDNAASCKRQLIKLKEKIKELKDGI